MKQPVSILYKSILLPILLLVAFAANIQNIQAQTTHPVQANVYLAPPYSNYLSDYYTTSKEKLVVTLLNRDQQRPTLDVRLRVSVTAVNGLKIQSREEINYPIITLDAGIPTRLTQGDLEPYFLPRNINTQGSFNQGKLPEGMIEFTFQVIEKHTGKVLSAPATGRVWLSSQKPPILRLPSNNENVAFSDPLNLKFQWEPLHKNLSQVEYEFELKELPNTGVAPQSAFLYAIPIYRERLVHTYLMYNVMMPPLDPDKVYAWRVRAIAKDGVDDLNMFDNSGYSEVFCLRTASNCQPPFNCSADLKDRTLTLNWLPSEGNNEYMVQYRLKNDAKAEWKEGKTYDTQQTLYDMKRGATYEFRVGSICTSGQPVFTPTGEITIPAVDSARLARCGIPGVFNLDNKEPIESLKAGDVVMVNDYPMTLTQVAGGGGSFSGEGWVPVNWLLNTKWEVEFDNITVNTDRQMVAGSVRAKYDETEGQIAKVDEITEGGHENTREGIIFPNYELEDRVIPPNPTFEYDPQSGELTIYTTDGQQVGEPVKLKNDGKEVFPITIKDKEGNIYQVDTQKDENGEPVVDENGKPKLESNCLGKQGEALSKGSFNQKALSEKAAVVTFEKGNGIYALDKWNPHFKNSVKIRKEYDKLSDDYYASWKFLPVGGSDKITAVVEIASGNPAGINPDSIIFATQQGIRFQSKRLEDNRYELVLTAGSDKDVQEIYALYPKKEAKSQYLTLGKLNVVTYQKQVNELVLVQVNATINSYEVENKLKEVYAPVGVEWTVRTDEFNYKGDLSNFIDKPSGAFAAYNRKMKDLINAYKADKQVNSKACYMFVLKENGVSPENKDSRDAQGIMPRGEQFGFVFTHKGTKPLPAEELSMMAAHELGHGRWRLQHVFDGTYGFKDSDKGKTDNLMDYYSNGTELAKWQWEQLKDPAWFSNPFERDEKGMINLKPSEYLGFSPDGHIITKRPDKYNGIFLSENSFCITGFKTNIGTYEWIDNEKIYRLGSNDFLAWENDDPITGKVAVWKDSPAPDCFTLYQFIEVKDYISKDFDYIPNLINEYRWGPDYVESANKEVCEFIFEEWKSKSITTLYEKIESLYEKDHCSAIKLLYEQSDTLYSLFSSQMRFDFIKCIANEIRVDGDDEILIISLLTSTPVTEYSTLLSLFELDNSGLLKKLHSSIDGENLIKYYTALNYLYYLGKGTDYIDLQKQFLQIPEYTKVSWQSLAKDKNIFFWQSERFFKRWVNLFKDSEKSDAFKYENLSINEVNKLSFKIQLAIAFAPFSDNSQEISELGAFQLIRIDELAPSESLDKLSSDKDGTSYYLPAFNLLLLENEQWNGDVIDGMNLAFAISPVASGMIFQGGKVTLVAAGEIMLATSALAVDSYRSELEQTPEGRDFLDVYDKFMIAFVAYQGGKILVSLPEMFTSMKTQWQNWKNINRPIKDIDDKIAIIEKEIGIISNIVDDVLEIEIIYGKKFISKLAENSSLTSVERLIAEESFKILNSAQFKKIINGYTNKTPIHIEIKGRTISYDDAPFSGMTWFEKNGFNIGRDAFASEEELIKTVLHEMHRLNTSTLRGAGTAAEVSKETKAAFDYAEKVFKFFE